MFGEAAMRVCVRPLMGRDRAKRRMRRGQGPVSPCGYFPAQNSKESENSKLTPALLIVTKV